MWALVFYILTFTHIGDPANGVYAHHLKSWQLPYTLADKAECEAEAEAIRMQQPNPDSPGYEHLCKRIDKQSMMK